METSAQESHGGKRDYWLQTLVSVGFVLVLAGTGFIDLWIPATAPLLLADERQAEDEMRARARFGDGSRARLFEYDLRLKSRIRRILGWRYATLLYATFGEVSRGTLAGKGDWLFLRTRALPPDTESQLMADLTASVLRALERRAASLGQKLCFAPVPRKAVIHQELLPMGTKPRPDIERRLVAELKRRGVCAADLLELFKSQSSESVYFPLDTHWTTASCVLAAEEMCRAAGLWVRPDKRRTKIVRETMRTPGERLDLLGFNEIWFTPEHLEKLRDQGLGHWSIAHGQTGARALPKGLSFGRDSGRVAICGTSFSDHRLMPRSLAHFSQLPVLNSALSAASFMHPLRLLLSNPQRLKPLRAILVEFPVHQIFFNSNSAGEILLPSAVGDIFAENTPTKIVPVLAAKEIEVATAFQSDGFVRLFARDLLEVCRLPAGRLFHSGDGVVALEIEGRVRGGTVTLELVSGGVRMYSTWPEGAERLVLPIVTPQPGALEVRLFAVSKNGAELEFGKAQVVCDLPDCTRIDIATRAPRQDNGIWQAETPLELPGASGVLSVLVCDISEEAQVPTSLRLTARYPLGEKGKRPASRGFSLAGCLPGTRVVWNDGLFAPGGPFSLTFTSDQDLLMGAPQTFMLLISKP
ncbi:MAG: hypothetical protein ABGY71_15895 [bacterium]|jgi:hypothetical protein|nr:hypothetical protein [Planctomycetota bacterium]HIL37234.1 hypothetical protein [Planctomycetota bacterium]